MNSLSAGPNPCISRIVVLELGAACREGDPGHQLSCAGELLSATQSSWGTWLSEKRRDEVFCRIEGFGGKRSGRAGGG